MAIIPQPFASLIFFCVVQNPWKSLTKHLYLDCKTYDHTVSSFLLHLLMGYMDTSFYFYVTSLHSIPTAAEQTWEQSATLFFFFCLITLANVEFSFLWIYTKFAYPLRYLIEWWWEVGRKQAKTGMEVNVINLLQWSYFLAFFSCLCNHR